MAGKVSPSLILPLSPVRVLITKLMRHVVKFLFKSGAEWGFVVEGPLSDINTLVLRALEPGNPHQSFVGVYNNKDLMHFGLNNIPEVVAWTIYPAPNEHKKDSPQ